MKIRLLLFLCLSTSLLCAQQNIPEDPAGPGRWGPVTLASEFLENNFFNYSLFVSGVYDSYAPLSSNQNNTSGAFGYQVGGAINASHRFRRGGFGLSYFGSYQDYQSTFFSSGTNQNLNFLYTTQLGRRWSLAVSQGAGILFYGNGYLGPLPTSGTYVQANPFSSQTRFISSSVSMGYQLTRRVGLYVNGSFFLQRFNYSAAIGTTGGSGGTGVRYRVTARTSISGDYSHSYYSYQRGAGEANIDTVSFSYFHRFPGHWSVVATGGFSHSDTSGFVTIPLPLQNGQQGVGGYITGRYNTKANLPSFFGSVTRNLRKSSFSFGGGQSIVSGNGYYLASRNQFLNGGYSRSYRRSGFNAGFNLYRLTSQSNTVGQSFTTVAFGAGYGYTVARHIGANFRYDYLRFGYLQPLNAVSDNRLTFSVNFSSKSIPLTLY